MSQNSRAFVGIINGILFNDLEVHLTLYPPGSHWHSSGHIISIVAGRITNHNQNMTTGAANSSDNNTTVSFDAIASCCNLREERKIQLNVTVLDDWLTVHRS
jgi:hypothetical protein